MSPNVPLFEHIAKRADEMYADCLERVRDHERAGRYLAASSEATKLQHYLAFKRKAHFWLDRSRNESGVAA